METPRIDPELSGEEKENLTAEELVNKHIRDRSHVITDEEMRNLTVGEEADDQTLIDVETKRREKEIKNESPEDNLPNPFNVLH
jgi:hypothetical protein